MKKHSFKRLKEMLTLGAGIVIGLILAGPVAQAAEDAYLRAYPSPQTFYVDGQRVELEAYGINGYNYVRLRDIGQLMDFNVAYDPVKNAAVIQSGRPYIGEDIVLSDATLANGKPVTEENVLDLLHEIEKDWPTGTVWGTHTTPGTHRNKVPSTATAAIMRKYTASNVYGCSGYAAMVSSLVFGDETNPGRKLDDLSQIRPGDIVFILSTEGKVSHVAVALESPNEDGRFHCTDGNVGEEVRWPNRDSLCVRSYSTAGFSSGSIEVWTRYPEDTPAGNSAEAWK